MWDADRAHEAPILGQFRDKLAEILGVQFDPVALLEEIHRVPPLW
jgi:hypothetical protein